MDERQQVKNALIVLFKTSLGQALLLALAGVIAPLCTWAQSKPLFSWTWTYGWPGLQTAQGILVFSVMLAVLLCLIGSFWAESLAYCRPLLQILAGGLVLYLLLTMQVDSYNGQVSESWPMYFGYGIWQEIFAAWGLIVNGAVLSLANGGYLRSPAILTWTHNE
jgi:hypothetical protein